MSLNKLYNISICTRYKVIFPKTKKAWVAQPVFEKSFAFVKELVDEMKECHESDLKLPKQKAPAHIPRKIVTEPKPPKDEIIKMHKSRMVKKN